MARETLVLRLIQLAAPIALGRAGVMLMGVTNLVVMGQFAPGDLGALGLAWTISGPALLGGIGLMTGVQILAARAVGEGRPQAAGGVWRRGLALALAAGLGLWLVAAAATQPLLTAAGVAPGLAARAGQVAGLLAFAIAPELIATASTNLLQGLGKPVPSMIAQWGANLANLAFNLALVPAYGAMGSAAATAAARLVMTLMLVGYVLWAPGLAGVRTRAADARGWSPLLRIGAAAAVATATEAAAFAIMTIIAGRVGGLAVATLSISTQLVSVVYMLSIGLGAAGGVLAAQAMGAGTPGAATRAGWAAIGLDVAAMAVCGGLCLAFAQPIGRAYTSDPALITSVAAVMGLTALLMIPDGGQGVADAALRARGDNWAPTAIRLASYFLIAPPLGLWLTARGGGVAGVMWALVVSSLAGYGALVARHAWLGRPR